MNTLYTIGYTGLKLREFTTWLNTHGVTLVDARQTAYSPNPDWNKATLKRVFGDQYHHVRALGNRNYKTGGDIVLNNVEEGVQAVAELLQHGPVVLLCTCSDVETCHRKVAAEAVSAATGAPVVHLSPTQLKAANLMQLSTSSEGRVAGALVAQPTSAEDVQHALPGFGIDDKIIPPTQLKLL